MEKLTDSEVLARLIYRAYIAPDPHAPLEAEALLPFQAALELYARTWKGEAQGPKIVYVSGGTGGGGGGGDGAGGAFWTPQSVSDPDTAPDCGDFCPVELAEEPRETPPLREKNLDGFQPVSAVLKGADTHTHTAGTTDGGGGKPAAFAGKGAEEKRQIYARLMAFIAAHGLGTRRRLAELSNGALQISDLQDMTDAHPVPLAKWRIAAACMEKMENDERND